MAIVYAWRVLEPHANSEAARRIPPWKMSETEAGRWASRWGVRLEKIEGTQETFRPQSADRTDRNEGSSRSPGD
jgi:hypothetical protein